MIKNLRTVDFDRTTTHDNQKTHDLSYERSTIPCDLKSHFGRNLS